MGKAHAPRKGSMQVWPRRRAKRPYTRVRSWADTKEAIPLGFAGYKAGMTHVIATDNRKTSITKGTPISIPVTIIECPPIRVHSIKGYKKVGNDLKAATEVLAKPDKDIRRKLTIPKKDTEKKAQDLKAEDFFEFRLLVQTQPKLTGIGKKKPDVFEIAIGGNVAEQLEYAKSVLGKELHINDLFKAGEHVDIHAVTKGKGFQGALKRFGVKRTSHKSEKGIRTPGSLGGWIAQGISMYRVAKAGKMGFHNRTEYNKWIISINSDPKTAQVKGGFVKYGEIKNPYIMIKGSVHGSINRIIRFNKAIRPNKLIPNEAPSIEYVSLGSNQGR